MVAVAKGARRGAGSRVSENRLSECSRSHPTPSPCSLAPLALLALLLPCSAASGQEPPPRADDDSTGAAVHLAPLRAEVRRSLLDPGLARSVERLEPGDAVLPFRDLADWLASRTAAGVRGYGAGGRQVLSVRGGRPEGVLVLLDGLPINDPLTGEADLSTVPLSSLESATLVRGAGSARYGTGALGGALLLESSAAGEVKPAARLSAGSHGAYDATASAGWSDGGAAVRLGAGLRSAENDYTYENRLAHDSPEERRENADSRTRWLNLTADAAGIRATARLEDLERGVPGRLGTSAFAGDRWSETRWSASAAAGGSGASGRIGARRLVMRYTPGGAGGAGGGGSAGTRPSVQRAFDVRAGGELVLPGIADLVVAGRLSFERLEGDQISGTPGRSAAGATVRRSFGGDVGFGVEPLVGIDVSDGDAALSPELGAWYRPDERTRFYARVGRAYRLPTFADLHFEAAPGLRANPDLEPERVVLDAELGAEASRGVAGGEASARVALWSRDTRRPIVWLASSVAVWSPRNLERLAARGIDLEGRFESASPGAARASGWAVEAGMTLQRSRVGFGSNRNPLPYQPGVRGHAGLELWRGETTARVAVDWTGSRTTTLAATRRLPAFATLDVAVGHRFSPGPIVLETTLGVRNLLDHRYELVELFPEPGRTLHLTLDVH